MNTVLLNTINLDDGRIIKKGSGGGGGVTIKNQSKSVDIVKNGTTEVVADAGFTGLGKVTINTNVASSGGGGVSYASVKDVNFRDYDGTILYSYTKDEFLDLDELPALPSLEGLICQEWNWSLDNAKSHVLSYDCLEVGANYITDDGATRLMISIVNEGRYDITIFFNQSAANCVDVDWGDGSPVESYSDEGEVGATHSYANKGNYVISLKVQDGCTITFGKSASSSTIMGAVANNNRVYCAMLKSAFIGNGVNEISAYTFQMCYGLETIVLHKGVAKIDSSAFSNCYSLKYAAIPSAASSIGQNAFSLCYSLNSVSLPMGVDLGASAFQNCNTLSGITIPNGCQNIGQNAFSNCYSLKSIIIPSSTKSVGNSVFTGCQSLRRLKLSEGVETLGNSVCANCQSLTDVRLPNSLTSAGNYLFQQCVNIKSLRFSSSPIIPGYVCMNCYGLIDVEIPEGVTTIKTYAFQQCYSVAKFKLPSTITTLENGAFTVCYGVKCYDFTSSTRVPTLANAVAFGSIPSDCKIVVPDTLYDAWIAATNWSNSNIATKIVKASDYYKVTPSEYGVYIQHVDGTYKTTDEWAANGYSNDEANGVAVYTENAGFVIGKEDLSSKMWSTETNNIIDGVTATSDAAVAKADYAGNNNTELMLNSDTSGAAFSCSNYTFPNGAKGYLPALGEWYVAYQNKSLIDAAMKLISASAINGDYWSSTQYGGSDAWYIGWSNGSTYEMFKYYTYKVRPFALI